VLGIDPSLTSTGIAIVSRDGARTACVKSAPPKRTKGDKRPATLAERRGRIRRIVADVIDAAVMSAEQPTVPTLAVIEGPSYSSAGAGTWDRAWLWGSVVDHLLDDGIAVAVCPPAVRARWATGSGAGSKSLVGVHMSRMWPDLDPDITDDQWDALALASIGAQRLGLIPLALERHREHLGKVAWPDEAEATP
jgi:Holliday junction resolvasome RuvABC endonuclease subunit